MLHTRHLPLLILLLCFLTVGCKKMNSDLEPWLAKEDLELQNAVVADIGRHLDALKEKGETFYGFVAVPGDYCTQPEPTSLSIAFNRESDIASEHADDLFYRYCPEEWKTEIREGFDTTNEILKASFDKFNSMHNKNPNNFMMDRYEIAFVARRDTAIINALKALKESGRLKNGTFLSIWFWGSQYAVTEESVKILNSPEVHQTFVSVFK